MSYTVDSIRDSIRIRIVTPDSIRIRFERKRPIRRSLDIKLVFMQKITFDFRKSTTTVAIMPPELHFLTPIGIKSFVGWGFAPDSTGGAYSAPQTS